MNWQYLYLLFQSNFFEVLICLYFYRGRLPWMRIVLLVSICNAITHPLVIFGFLRHTSFSFLVGILTAEIFAITVEAALHSSDKHIPHLRALCASTIANLVSWQIGPALTTVLFMRDHLK